MSEEREGGGNKSMRDQKGEADEGRGESAWSTQKWVRRIKPKGRLANMEAIWATFICE
jgi:hypothetical protein